MSENTPDISVVISVYNGSAHLRQTLDSVLSQEGVKLELIVINDGSTDESGEILESYGKRDKRVRIIHQENKGLTHALIVGCAAARGRFIARQDIGDISLPGRLLKQLTYITQDKSCAVVSCWTRFREPGGEDLYDVIPDPDEAMPHLLTLKLNDLRGPSHHGSTLFSKEHYERVRGYRSEFYFAQDVDLWIRLSEQGKHVILPEVLYEAVVTVQSISGLYRKEQIETVKLALESARLRRTDLSDELILRKVQGIRSSVKRKNNRFQRAKALYFIGSCLRKRRSPEAAHYFQKAFRSHPLHVKSAFRLLFPGSLWSDRSHNT